jgi:hypothetical protein
MVRGLRSIDPRGQVFYLCNLIFVVFNLKSQLQLPCGGFQLSTGSMRAQYTLSRTNLGLSHSFNDTDLLNSEVLHEEIIARVTERRRREVTVGGLVSTEQTAPHSFRCS